MLFRWASCGHGFEHRAPIPSCRALVLDALWGTSGNTQRKKGVVRSPVQGGPLGPVQRQLVPHRGQIGMVDRGEIWGTLG